MIRKYFNLKRFTQRNTKNQFLAVGKENKILVLFPHQYSTFCKI